MITYLRKNKLYCAEAAGREEQEKKDEAILQTPGSETKEQEEVYQVPEQRFPQPVKTIIMVKQAVSLLSMEEHIRADLNTAFH